MLGGKAMSSDSTDSLPEISRGKYVTDDHYVRECRACEYVELRSLPSVQKKVIYLDQWVWSRIKQALRRLRDGEKLNEQNEVFREIFLRLDRLMKLMVVVCPVSPIHEAE